MTVVVGVRHNLVFDTDDVEEARAAARRFGELLAAGHNPLTRSLCLLDDGRPAVARVVWVGHETGYHLAPSAAPPTTGTPAREVGA
jgi:hypothetical protein